MCFASGRNAQQTEQNLQKEQSMKEVYDFLRTCGVYYLATVENDQPRVRPLEPSLFLSRNFIYRRVRKRMWPGR
jgi:hypothetical protein